MIVSRNGTTYDTSDGSQQPHEASAEGLLRSDREQINRWEDDGPGPHAHTAPPTAERASKPAWSVLSLTNLLEAIRQLRDEPTDAPSLQEKEGSERDRASLERNRLDRVAAAADAERCRYRNAWENT
jgi:hypothetical protein